MNEKMRTLSKYSGRVTRILNSVTKQLLTDESVIIHPTVVTKTLIDSFHRTHSDVLEISSIYRITKDIPNTPLLYLAVVYQRYGRTFKPKLVLLMDRVMSNIQDYEINSNTLKYIINSLVELIKNNLN